MTKLKLPSNFGLEAKIQVSDAVMSAGVWGNEANSFKAIQIIEKSVRGTISNRMKGTKANDPAKLNAEIEKANLQTIDHAALPFDCDTLKVDFTIRTLSGLKHFNSCNDQDYAKAFGDEIDRYVEEFGFGVLAARYAENLANGRFLWRNRVGAEEIKVVVRHADKSFEFDAYDFKLRSFDNADKVKEVTEIIERGLLGNGSSLLEVSAFVKLGNGQNVFPSQELVLDSNIKKGKILYALNGQAAMHTQKIGNAIRTIDTWHGDKIGAIAVEPYGSVTSISKAFRQPSKKMDFYSLIDNWMLKGKEPETEQKHYIMAMLIRGGVFGGKGE